VENQETYGKDFLQVSVLQSGSLPEAQSIKKLAAL